ncbi:hypothetical protein HZS_7233 [Henneguya salminicola]|nr:hypothetical protein HZS_7233 [Henneguya salminicola]
MEDIASSDIIDVRIFRYDSNVRKKYDNICEALKIFSPLITYDKNTITVNPFNKLKKYLAVQVMVHGKSVFRTYPLYLFHLFQFVKKIYKKRATIGMKKKHHIAVNYKFEEFSNIESDFLTSMIHLALHTIHEYKDLPAYSSIWSTLIKRNNFTLIMFAGRGDDPK